MVRRAIGPLPCDPEFICLFSTGSVAAPTSSANTGSQAAQLEPTSQFSRTAGTHPGVPVNDAPASGGQATAPPQQHSQTARLHANPGGSDSDHRFPLGSNTPAGPYPPSTPPRQQYRVHQTPGSANPSSAIPNSPSNTSMDYSPASSRTSQSLDYTDGGRSNDLDPGSAGRQSFE